MWGLSYTCFSAFDALEQFGEIEFECSSHGHDTTVIVKDYMLSEKFTFWGIIAIIRNWVQIPKNMSMDA